MGRFLIFLSRHHIHKWQSLAVLSDTWTSMYTAICCPSLCQSGFFNCFVARDLMWMRCNEYSTRGASIHTSRNQSPPFVALIGVFHTAHILQRYICGFAVSFSGSTRTGPTLPVSCSTRAGTFQTNLTISNFSYHCYDVRSDFEKLC